MFELDSTVALELALEACESADVELTVEVPVATLVLLEVSADMLDAGAETPVVGLGVSKALPLELLAAAPLPAPDEDPAVFD